VEEEANDGASEAHDVTDDVDAEERLVHALAHVEALQRREWRLARGWRLGGGGSGGEDGTGGGGTV
jgi:hypothetical protein